MQSGAPTFGTPEPALVLYVMAALARRLGVPFRSGGSLCASKMRRRPGRLRVARRRSSRPILGGVNFVLHAAGWLEGGLAVGYEKFILDADQCGMMAVFVNGVDMSRQRPGARRDPGERARAALPRHRPHAGQLRDRLLPLATSPTTTASSSGRRTARSTPRSAPTRSGSGCSPSTRRRRSTRAIDEALLEFIARRKASMPDSEV